MKKKSYSVYVVWLIVVSLLSLAASIMACGRQSNVADIAEITPETSIRTNASETAADTNIPLSTTETNILETAKVTNAPETVANSNYPEITVETNIPEIVTETTIPDYLLEHIKDINSNLQTYECETEMTLYIKNESQKEDMTFVRKSSVALDKINGNMSVSIEESESGEFNNSRVDEPFTGAKGVLYFIGKDTYFGGYDENGKSVSWDKNLYDEEERGQIAVTNWQAELQMGILEKSTVKLIQLEDLQGTLCYLVEISPDLNSLFDYARWEGMDVEANYQQRLQGVKNATADYWFDRDSLLFERAYIYFEVEIEGGMPLYYTFEANMTFDKINEKLDIQLPPEANELSAENIQDRVLDDQPAINTHTMDSNMTIHKRGTAAGKIVNESIFKKIDGSFDMLDHKYGAEVTTNITRQLGEEILDTTNKKSYYVLNNVAYFGNSVDNGKTAWEIIPSPPQERLNEMADQTLLMGRLSNLLISGKVVSVSPETLQGIECYLVELVPNNDNLYDYLQVVGEMNLPFDYWQFYSCVKIASAHLWITRNNYYFKKACVYMEAQINIGDQLYYDMEINMNFDKINEPVGVQLPDEIKNN